MSCVQSEGTGKSTIHSCPEGYVFNSKTGTCTKDTNKCTIVKCPKELNTYIPYGPNPAYYVLCNGTEKIMNKCVDVINQVYDPAQGKCQYKCKKSGTYVDRQNCHKYYHCSGKRRQLKVKHVECPDGYSYKKGKGCIRGQCKNEIP